MTDDKINELKVKLGADYNPNDYTVDLTVDTGSGEPTTKTVSVFELLSVDAGEEVAQIPMELSVDIGNMVCEYLADEIDEDSEDILIKSIVAPNKVSYIVTSNKVSY